MKIRLYKLFVKRINSTKQPTGTYTEKDVNLKRNTSIQAPVFILSGFDPSYNFVYVPDWGRYYFIEDVVLGNTNLFEVHCRFDALASYKASIGAYTCFVERTSDNAKIDPYIRDHAVSCDDRVSSTESASTDVGFSSGGYIYLLRILGYGNNAGVSTFIIGNRYNLQNLFNSIFLDVNDSSFVATVKTMATLYADDPANYIQGVFASPIGITKYSYNVTGGVRVYCGGHDTGLELDRINFGDAKICENLTLNKPINMYTDWRATDPSFSSYTIYIPTVGTMPIPAEIINKELKMTISADLIAGDLCFGLYAEGDLIATYNSNCYSNISVGVQSGNAGANIVNNGLGVVGGLSTGNLVTAGTNVIQGVKNLLNPPASVIGSQGGTGCISSNPDVVITCIQKSSADAPQSVYGKPCCKNLLLSGVSGFIKCAGASIDNIAGTSADKELVNSYMNNGFYME